MAKSQPSKEQEPKRVITVVTDPLINNLDVLGASFNLSETIEVRFHRHPQINIRGNDVSYNFDIMISNGGSDQGFNFGNVLPPHRYVKLARYDKFSQAIRLLNACEDYKQQNKAFDYLHSKFIPVPTWFVGLQGSRSFPNITGKVVIKPQDGARGVGQFVVDTTYVNLNQFNKKLDKYLTTTHTDEAFKVFLDGFAGNVAYYSRDEDTPGEGLQCLKEQGGIVQSFIPNVSAEYRIITGADSKPLYFQRRKMRDVESDYPQATGGGDVIDVKANRDNPFDQDTDAKKLFEYLCQTVIGPLNSIDLFITGDGHWGIFEYCNQFGVSGIPAAIAEEIHAEFMHDVVTNFISTERAFRLKASL